MSASTINAFALDIHRKVTARAKLANEDDCHQFLAWRIIDAVEWGSPSPEMTKPIALKVLTLGVSGQVAAIIRKYFGL